MNINTKIGLIVRNNPVVGIKPGFITLQVTDDFISFNLLANSNDVIILHNLESLYALSGSYSPPSTILTGGKNPLFKPDKLPKEIGLTIEKSNVI